MSVSSLPVTDRANTSLLARIDGRFRLVALFVLSFAFSAVSTITTVPYMLATAALFWAISGLPVGYLLKRLRYPSFLVLAYILVLLFFAGTTPLYEFGFLKIREEGLHTAILIASRFYSILTVAIACFSVTTLLGNITALRALGLPYVLVDIALLMARYLEVLRADIERMTISMRLRGHQRSGWSLTTIRDSAWLVGSLLTRSYSRAEDIYKAMRLRGYGDTGAHRRYRLPGLIDWIFALIVICISIAFFFYR